MLTNLSCTFQEVLKIKRGEEFELKIGYRYFSGRTHEIIFQEHRPKPLTQP